MIKPIQLLAAMGFISSALFSCGDGNAVIAPPTDTTAKSISLKIDNGTSLSYKVSPTEMVTYTLDITFRELSPKLSYDFVMTNMDYTKGSVEQDENVRKTAHVHTNQFVNGKTILADRTSLVISSGVYRDLVEVGKATINWDGEETTFKLVSNEDYKFEKGNGHVTETVMHCTNEDKTKEFWVWKNPELPLLMKTKNNNSGTMELVYWYLPGERQ